MNAVNRVKSNQKPQCVRCRWDDKQRTEPLLKPCHCNDNYKSYHYQCLCDLIVETADAPCRGCDRRFEDPHIVRDPPKYLKFFLQHPLQHIFGSLPLIIGLIIFAIFLARERSRSSGPLCPIHNYPRPTTVSLVTFVLATLFFLCAIHIRVQYKKWFQTQDRLVIFRKWKNSNDIHVFNVSEVRRKRRQKV